MAGGIRYVVLRCDGQQAAVRALEEQARQAAAELDTFRCCWPGCRGGHRVVPVLRVKP